jgi:hypothetical protein
MTVKPDPDLPEFIGILLREGQQQVRPYHFFPVPHHMVYQKKGKIRESIEQGKGKYGNNP